MLKCDVVAADVEDRRSSAKEFSAGLVPDPVHGHSPAGGVAQPAAVNTAGTGGGDETGAVGLRGSEADAEQSSDVFHS